MYYLFSGDIEVYPYQGYNKFDLEQATEHVKEFGSQNFHDYLESTYRHDNLEQVSLVKALVELPVDYLEYGEFNSDELIEALHGHVVVDDCILYHIKGIEELELSDGYSVEVCPEDQIMRLNGNKELFNTDDNREIVYSAPMYTCKLCKDSGEFVKGFLCSCNPDNPYTEANIENLIQSNNKEESNDMDMQETINTLNNLHETRQVNTFEAGVLFAEIKASESFKPAYKSFNKLAEATKWSRQTVHSLVKIMGIDGLNERETFVALGFGTIDKLAKAYGSLDESDFNQVLNFALTPGDNGKIPTQKSVCEAIKNAGEEVDPIVKDPNDKTLADWQKEKSALLVEQTDLQTRLAQVLIELTEAESAIQDMAK